MHIKRSLDTLFLGSDDKLIYWAYLKQITISPVPLTWAAV
jgi:hypothetical protein